MDKDGLIFEKLDELNKKRETEEDFKKLFFDFKNKFRLRLLKKIKTANHLEERVNTLKDDSDIFRDLLSEDESYIAYMYIESVLMLSNPKFIFSKEHLKPKDSERAEIQRALKLIEDYAQKNKFFEYALNSCNGQGIEIFKNIKKALNYSFDAQDSIMQFINLDSLENARTRESRGNPQSLIVRYFSVYFGRILKSVTGKPNYSLISDILLFYMGKSFDEEKLQDQVRLAFRGYNDKLPL
jgi:hypothetical protein